MESRGGVVEKVTIFNSLGQRLAGCLHMGRSSSVTLGPTVVLCHGMLSTKDGTKQVALARVLSELGFAVLRFDFSFVGESEGKFEEITFSQEVDDLRSAVAWVRGRGAGPVGLLGSSMGGAVAILYARTDPEVRALVTVAAVARPARLAGQMGEMRAHVARWKAEGAAFGAEGEVGPRFFEDARRQDVMAAVEAVSAPLLILHGGRDEVVPVEEAHALAQRARGDRHLRILAEADHRFSRVEDLRELIAASADWFARHLRP
mgnify:FL=1